MAHLSETQINNYHKEGWLIPYFWLSSREISHLRNVREALIAANPDVRAKNNGNALTSRRALLANSSSSHLHGCGGFG